VTLKWVMSDHLIGNMNTRKCVITSSYDWDELHVSDSFVPKYKDMKAPNDPNAEIFTLGKYYANTISDNIQKAIQLANNPSLTLQITTAYDTTSNSRLIVDGFKRALGILDMINNGRQFRPTSILECYGRSIPQMFSCEFAHIIKNKSSRY